MTTRIKVTAVLASVLLVVMAIGLYFTHRPSADVFPTTPGAVYPPAPTVQIPYDRTFGINGTIDFTASGYEGWINNLQATTDNKFVAAGSLLNPSTKTYLPYIMRWNQNGVSDGSFQGGAVDLSDPDHQLSNARILVTADDGSLIVAVYSDSATKIIRLLPNGFKDQSFGTAGQIALPVGVSVSQAHFLRDGHLLVVGTNTVTETPQANCTVKSTKISTLRYTTNGQPDSTYGNGTGAITWGPPKASFAIDQIQLLPKVDGSYVIVAYADSNADYFDYQNGGTCVSPLGSRIFVTHLNDRGDADMTFSNSLNYSIINVGKVLDKGGYSFGGATLLSTNDLRIAIRQEPSQTSSEAAILQLTPTYMLDTAIGANGVAILEAQPTLANLWWPNFYNTSIPDNLTNYVVAGDFWIPADGQPEHPASALYKLTDQAALDQSLAAGGLAVLETAGPGSYEDGIRYSLGLSPTSLIGASHKKIYHYDLTKNQPVPSTFTPTSSNPTPSSTGSSTKPAASSDNSPVAPQAAQPPAVSNTNPSSQALTQTPSGNQTNPASVGVATTSPSPTASSSPIVSASPSVTSSPEASAAPQKTGLQLLSDATTTTDAKAAASQAKSEAQDAYNQRLSDLTNKKNAALAAAADKKAKTKINNQFSKDKAAASKTLTAAKKAVDTQLKAKLKALGKKK